MKNNEIILLDEKRRNPEIFIVDNEVYNELRELLIEDSERIK